MHVRDPLQVMPSSAFDCLRQLGGRRTDRHPDHDHTIASIDGSGIKGQPPTSQSGIGGGSGSSNVVKVQQSEALKPFLRDRLQRLPNAPLFPTDSQCAAVGINRSDSDIGEGGGGVERVGCNGGEVGPVDQRRLQFLECTVTFLCEQHAELLSALHNELDVANRKIQGGHFFSSGRTFDGCQR